MLWYTLFNDGIFATPQAQIGVLFAITTHYLLGSVLVLALLRKGGR